MPILLEQWEKMTTLTANKQKCSKQKTAEEPTAVKAILARHHLLSLAGYDIAASSAVALRCDLTHEAVPPWDTPALITKSQGLRTSTTLFKHPRLDKNRNTGGAKQIIL